MPSQQQAVQQPAAQQQVVAGSTRWCPTPEQLMILEEMYRGGLRTPNASQIQQITAHLACYGRIEGKNVFYWFQNHKARDRQKLRRRLCMSHHLLSCAHQYYHHHAFLAPPATLPAAPPYGCGGVFDQAGHLLSPTSPTPAAAAAAAAYGYYYPTAAAAFAAAPETARCGGATSTPPSPNALFHYQGGGVVPAEALGRPEYSLGKLDHFGVQALDNVVSAAVDMGPPGLEVVAPPTTTASSFCRPLKTLDLFPGGLKEEQHDVV